MKMKAFELEDKLSEASEKVVETISTGVSQPISEIAAKRTNA